MTRCAVVLLLLLLACGVPPAHAARSAAARKAVRALTAAVEPRRGLRHRSLVVVPLVARSKPIADGPVTGTEGFAWSAAQKKALDQASVTAPASAAPRTLHPSGRLLVDPGVQERLLVQPLLQAAATTQTVGTLRLPPLVRPPKAARAPAGGLARLAPPEFRRALFHTGDALVLRDLLALEGALAGLDPSGATVTLADVFAAPRLQPRLKTARKALAALPRAYGGEVLGHVAYLGNRPAEVVLARSAATYASFAREATPGLALALTLWEALHARDGAPPEAPPPAWEPFLEDAGRHLATLAGAAARAERGPGRPAPHGSLWRLRATRDRHGRKPGDVGRLLLDEQARGLWLEAWPGGEVAPLPSPARTPGGKGHDEDPHDRKGGALTKPYLERFLERFHKRRRAMTGGG